MWTYHADLLARPVPRYTSFPTAAEFAEDVGAEDYAVALDGIAPGTSISLYLHVPFCERICWYCGCNTARTNRRERLGSYLTALRAEIALVAERLAHKQLQVRRISFGGGSPNALDPLAFDQLLKCVKGAFRAKAAEVSVELDPRSHSREWRQVLADGGIRLASLGVQTFSPRLQQAIGRVQDTTLIKECVADLRAAGVVSLNFDLMYGLPGQTEADLLETLEQARAFLPDRIALFGYAHVPHLLPRQRQIDGTDLPDARARFVMARLGHEYLTGRGYRAVGFDHFARPADSLAEAARWGGVRRNFQGFTNDPSDILLGLGASAISQFPGLIVQNEKNTGRYRMRVSSGRLASDRGVKRTEAYEQRAAVIEGLLCRGVGDLSGLSSTLQEMSALERFERRGLLTLEDGFVRILPEGRPYSRVIAAVFDPFRSQPRGRFSNAI